MPVRKVQENEALERGCFFLGGFGVGQQHSVFVRNDGYASRAVGMACCADTAGRHVSLDRSFAEIL
jgi:hypothetical protein